MIVWSRCGRARIGVPRAEGPWKADRELVDTILVSLIGGEKELASRAPCSPEVGEDSGVVTPFCS